MSIHVITGSTAPTTAPTQLGEHYVDTVNKKHYLSVGISSLNDWVDFAQLEPSSISHAELQDIGVHTHVQIDSHIDQVTGNPHGVNKSDVGLSNVQNLDQTNPSNISQDSNHRFVSDTEKSTWNAKENAVTSGTTSQYYRGDKSWQTLDKSAVGLSNVTNVDSTQRSNHTGTQIASTISDFSTSVDSRISLQKGAANGLATLGADTKIPAAQLPSFVDDVLEYANLAAFPSTGESGKLYIALDTNKTYRWSGTQYAEVSQSLALGETSSTAYRGDRGKTAYDHSQLTSGNPHGSTTSDISEGTNLYHTSSRAIDAAKTNLTNTPPPLKNITDAAYQGSSTEFARADHNHAFNTTGVIPGTYGDSDSVGSFTVNSQGQIISASTIDIPDATQTTHGLMSAEDKVKIDTMLEADFWFEFVASTTYINSSSVAFTNITDLEITVSADKFYYIEYTLLFRSVSVNTGVGFSFGWTGTGSISAVVNMPVQSDGTNALYSGSITSQADVVVGTGVQTANTTYVANIKGVFTSTSAGTFVPQFRSEVNGSQVSIVAGSIALIREF